MHCTSTSIRCSEGVLREILMCRQQSVALYRAGSCLSSWTRRSACMQSCGLKVDVFPISSCMHGESEPIDFPCRGGPLGRHEPLSPTTHDGRLVLQHRLFLCDLHLVHQDRRLADGRDHLSGNIFPKYCGPCLYMLDPATCTGASVTLCGFWEDTHFTQSSKHTPPPPSSSEMDLPRPPLPLPDWVDQLR